MKAVQIVPVRTPEELAQVRGLFLEYGESLAFHLCFDSFQTELNGLPGDYAPPQGELFLACYGALPAGCVALRPLRPGIAELKRLYVRTEFRGCHVGRRLAEAAVQTARRMGCLSLRLDTLPTMVAARQLYESLDFRKLGEPPSKPSGEKPLEYELNLGGQRSR